MNYRLIFQIVHLCVYTMSHNSKHIFKFLFFVPANFGSTNNGLHNGLLR